MRIGEMDTDRSPAGRTTRLVVLDEQMAGLNPLRLAARAGSGARRRPLEQLVPRQRADLVGGQTLRSFPAGFCFLGIVEA